MSVTINAQVHESKNDSIFAVMHFSIFDSSHILTPHS